MMAVEIMEESAKQEAEELSLPSVSEASAAMLAVVSKGVVEVRSRGRGVGAGIIWDKIGPDHDQPPRGRGHRR